MNKPTEFHTADICVIGGGLAGMCAAISAARHGSRVVLIHDRPILGGNCSSEIRMWPLGAGGSNRRETGIFEEIVLNNMYRNPTRSYPIWDSVLFEAVRMQKNLVSLLNCSVYDAEMQENRIKSVYGWQLTTYKQHCVKADIFIDCSGDSILAELTGAEFRHGREARAMYGEDAAPLTEDAKTMGNSCLIQARETNTKIEYTAPEWARKLPDDSFLNFRDHLPDNFRNNYWWIELGGEQNTIKDSEEIRDDLLALSFGVWDHVKNRGDHKADNWELDWVGFLPGKRESRRYIGDHILTQCEVQNGGKFKDIIAYGGWQIDNHPPKGFDHHGEPTTYYPCPSPFGIPYGCIYSANVENLMFAGRNISATHAAMAASRVMGTCAILGQAAGTAAHIALKHGTDPHGVNAYINELQQTLMYDDCWLPGLKRNISEICKGAALSADCENAENLRNGEDRPTDENGDNGCYVPLKSNIVYKLNKPAFIKSVRIIFDSDLDRNTVTGGIQNVRDCPTICNRPKDMPSFGFPTVMTKSFKLSADGETLYFTENNHSRFVTIPIKQTVSNITLCPLETYGADKSHIFSFDFE